MSAQVITRSISTLSIVRHPAFRRGARELFAGQAADERVAAQAQWFYERGRLFAAWLLAEDKPWSDRSDVLTGLLDEAFKAGAVL